MSPFHHQEPSNKRCKFLASTLKDAFSICHTFRRTLPTQSPQDDDSTSDFDVEEEVFVSAIISKYMESKYKRKTKHITDSFYLLITDKSEIQEKDTNHDEKEEFFDVGSRLSRCSSAGSKMTFVSVKTSFTRCSSLNMIEFLDTRRLSIIEEFRHCKGWPFGLCRKALLLPPLPKSPSDSWSWRIRTKTMKTSR